MTAPTPAPTPVVDLGSWPDAQELWRLLASNEKQKRKLAKRFGDDTLTTRVTWRNAVFQFTISAVRVDALTNPYKYMH